MKPLHSKVQQRQRCLGQRRCISAFIFVSIAVVFWLATMVVKQALIKRGLTFGSLAHGIVAHYKSRAITITRGDPVVPYSGTSPRKSEQALRRKRRAPPLIDAAIVEHREFCSPRDWSKLQSPKDLSSAVARQFDLVNNWGPLRRMPLESLPCAWAMHRNNAIRLPVIPLCGACNAQFHRGSRLHCADFVNLLGGCSCPFFCMQPTTLPTTSSSPRRLCRGDGGAAATSTS
jgi:hypothetical protein